MNINEIKALSPEELRAETRKISKQLITKIVIGVVVSVSVQLLATAILGKLEGSTDETEETPEVTE